VAKPVLGRGLGDLLGDAKNPDVARAKQASESAATQRGVAPGVAALLNAGTSHDEQERKAKLQSQPLPDSPFAPQQTQPGQASEPEWHIPRWLLVAADIFLMGLAALVVFKSPVRLKLWEMAICVGAIFLGALLAIAALLMDDKGRR